MLIAISDLCAENLF